MRRSSGYIYVKFGGNDSKKSALNCGFLLGPEVDEFYGFFFFIDDAVLKGVSITYGSKQIVFRPFFLYYFLPIELIIFSLNLYYPWGPMLGVQPGCYATKV